MAKSLEERIQSAHFKLMRHPTWCAFAGLVLMGSWKVVEKAITACVNVKGDKLYGRAYCSALNDKELMAAILHETLHFALQHLLVWKKLFKENAQLAGIAADHVVNNIIVDGDPNGAHVAIKKEWICDRKYRGWSVGEVYADLKKNPPPPQQSSYDEHDPNGDEDMTPEEVKELKNVIDTAVRNGAFMAGKIAGGDRRLFDQLTKTEVDWKEQLREFVQETCAGDDEATWKRPNRRFIGDDVYLPSMVSETMGELVVALDTSASTRYVFSSFMANMIAVAKEVRPSKMRVIYWDVGIQKEEVYELDRMDEVSHSQPKGCGGTLVAPVADYVKSLPDVQAAIILSDGEIPGSWDGQAGWGCPTLWCLTGRMMSPVGKTIHISGR